MKMQKIRLVLIICLALVFLFSAFNIIKILYDYKNADELYAELQKQIVTTDASSEGKIFSSINIDFEALKKENSDIIGWIYCPDTPINYPVVKGKDNSQYLRSDLKGKYLVNGTIFADYRNGEIGSDNNFIIYGHNMKNSAMFGTLVKYKDQAYYESHPVIYFLTPENTYVIELFAGAVVKVDSDIYQPNPPQNAVVDIISKSTFDSAIEIKEDTQIITLSTCSYEFNNARYVLLGKLKKI